MLCCCSFEAEKKGGYFHPLSDKAYETLLLLVQGKFNVHASRGMQWCAIGANEIACTLDLSLPQHCILMGKK